MSGDISLATNIYIVTGLSLRYFYPHLFETARIPGV